MKNKFGNLEANKLPKEQMKIILGGNGSYPWSDNRCFRCGCIDGDGIFYHGPAGAGYCLNTYQGEPWCVKRDLSNVTCIY